MFLRIQNRKRLLFVKHVFLIFFIMDNKKLFLKTIAKQEGFVREVFSKTVFESSFKKIFYNVL